jgi:hypothetical protein
VVVPLLGLIRAAGRARIGLLVDFDTDVIIVGDLLLLLVIAPVLLGRLSRPKSFDIEVRFKSDSSTIVRYRIVLLKG